MKKYLFSLVFVLGFMLNIHSAHASILPVQTGIGADDGTNSFVSANWGNPTVAGDLLVAIIGFKGGPSITITPPSGPIWTLAVRSNDVDISTAIYYIANAGAQSSSSAWTLSSAEPVTLTLIEYSGADSVSPMDTMSLATSTSTSQFVLGDSGITPTTATANEVAVAGITTASGNTSFSPPNNGFFDRGQISPTLSPMAPGIKTVFEEKFLFSTDTPNVQATINGQYATPTWGWAGAIATFKAAATPAPATDFCVNMAGVQATVPSGYVMDAAGNCTLQTTGGTDLCANLAGDQATVPSGFVMNAAGDCVQNTGGLNGGTPGGTTGGDAGGPGLSSGAGAGSGGGAQGEGIAPFIDISNSWASDYIQQLFKMGVVTGLTPTTFGPNENLTRAQTTKIALLTFGFQVPDVMDNPFKDVSASDWFGKYVSAAAKVGIVGGYANGTFMPNNAITRGEALKILLEAAAKANKSPSDYWDSWGNDNVGSFTDVDPSAWYAKYVNFAFANGIVNGKSPTIFAPNDNVTRGEISKMAVLTKSKFDAGSIGPAHPIPCKMKLDSTSTCGKLVIIKETNPLSTQTFHFNGSGGIGSFSLDNDGGTASPFTIMPKSKTFDLNPGNYTVTEVSTSGYSLNSVLCTSSNPAGIKNVTYLHDPNTNDLTGVTVGVPTGETITCTFTNGKLGTSGTGDTSVSGNVGQNPGMEGTVVGAAGKILYTNDAGLTWTEKTSGVNADLEGVSFVDKHNGIAVGHYGAITKTVNDGVTWTAQTSGFPSVDFTAVSFSTLTNATAVGPLGKIIHTTDGGVTWTAQTSGTTNSLYGVSFSGANFGVAVGENGTIIRTTNGGTTWTSQTSGTTQTLYGVSMSTTFIGTAVGESSSGSGIILHTVNAGVTWTPQTIPSTVTFAQHPDAVWFDANGMNGTVVGEQGLILTTTNGGTTWALQTNAPTTSTFGPQNFLGVSYYKAPYTNSAVGVLGSSHGTTARTINSGSFWTDITNSYTGTNAAEWFGVDMH